MKLENAGVTLAFWVTRNDGKPARLSDKQVDLVMHVDHVKEFWVESRVITEFDTIEDAMNLAPNVKAQILNAIRGTHG